MVINTCQRCGEEFESKRPSKFCSQKCRNQQWREDNPDHKPVKTKTCLNCSQPFPIHGRQGKRQFCSDRCREARSKIKEQCLLIRLNAICRKQLADIKQITIESSKYIQW